MQSPLIDPQTTAPRPVQQLLHYILNSLRTVKLIGPEPSGSNAVFNPQFVLREQRVLRNNFRASSDCSNPRRRLNPSANSVAPLQDRCQIVPLGLDPLFGSGPSSYYRTARRRGCHRRSSTANLLVDKIVGLTRSCWPLRISCSFRGRSAGLWMPAIRKDTGGKLSTSKLLRRVI
jgi:hypothetical protein